ncbi:glycerol-3-phosphate acyltransferase 1, mitochondrial isoform X1 [Hyposmocoma kahamanoa]|uniref:glycerol-3-phosphate acyltransferase 1, mitochondrial isoform X1 n=1 Tax=Hyposmocoma kahamanoa TaxID=1477025 RepID=UPI000E6DA28E|nr:glycerol-3-phosphate acyltransferase 1, mitochondrial isoform X1 [Hyposmocoma kahamanoa]
MDTMINVWAVVEHVRVASGAAELAIFTAILYWFFTSSRVADMLEVVGERVGGWCGRDSTSLRHAVRARRRPRHDIYAKLDAEIAARNTALYRLKDGPNIPPPQPLQKAPSGLACSRCAPLSRESWQDVKSTDSGNVINILDIGRQAFANGGVVARWFYDLSHCLRLINYDYTDIVPSVLRDERFQKALEEKTQEELRKLAEENQDGRGDSVAAAHYANVRKRVETRALKVLMDISSAMSNNVLRLVAWVCHKAIRRIASGGCGTRTACVERLRRAKAAGLPLVFVPLHRSHFDYILLTFTLYLMGLRPPLVAAGDNMRIPFFGWFLRGCGAFYIRRRVDGSEYHGDPIYKTALRAYILNSLAANNNLEFFIEGGRTRTGKPQAPKAGILSVIMDAYLDGTIDDALLVPATVNYDKLVDGNFVREQLGMPKQMETFWSAFRGIWRTLNTNHGSIRVDFNQPISLKELVTSFQKYNYLKGPVERALTPPNNNLSVNLDKQILYNHSHSSLYGDDVSTNHKMMVEAIGRHLVYDAAQATSLMSTNVLAYVLLTEQRQGCSIKQLSEAFGKRNVALNRAGRDLYNGNTATVIKHAMEMLGRGLVRREGSGDKQIIKPQLTIAASLELSYYANTVVAHYAAPAILATALESVINQPNADQEVIRHNELIEASLQLCEVLSQEFIVCPPCHRIEERMTDAIQSLIEEDVLISFEKNSGIEEQQWSRRFAKTFDDDDEEFEMPDPTRHIKYRISSKPEAVAERRRLVLTIRPLLEAYAATCRCLVDGSQKEVLRKTLDSLIEDYTQNRMPYGEAASMDAIRNCQRILRQWGVVDMYTEKRERRLRICEPYRNANALQSICNNIYKFNMDTPLLQ